MAQERSHPFTLAATLLIAALVGQFRRDVGATQAQAAAALALSTQHGFPYWAAPAEILHGWALAEQGQDKAGIAQIRRGLAAWRATGAEFWWPYNVALLAEAYQKAGQAEAGLALLTEALAVVHKSEERMWEAELYRLQGEVLLTLPPSRALSSPEACFRQALDIARRQQAKSLELRAAMSLSRLWQRQRKKKAARQLLAEIYGWFTEGFDTADLQEAAALLDALS
jgi:predicted ATPase